MKAASALEGLMHGWVRNVSLLSVSLQGSVVKHIEASFIAQCEIDSVKVDHQFYDFLILFADGIV